jgi:hypothetical protein
MPNVIHCPNCTKKLAVPESAAGKNARCPHCQQVFAIPAIAAAVPPPLPEANVAITAEPPPPPLPRRKPEPIPDDDEEPEEGRRPRRPPARRDEAMVQFKVTVKTDPDKKFKGFFDAKVTDEGLELRQGKKHDLLVPVGTVAEYEGKNPFMVEIDGREVTFVLAKLGSYQYRLTRDLVAYLNGDKKRLNPKRYKLEWFLIVPAALPFGIPIITLGGGLWFGIAFGVAGGCLGIAQQDKWSVGTRLLAMLALTFVAYAAVIALIIIIALNQPALPARRFP